MFKHYNTAENIIIQRIIYNYYEYRSKKLIRTYTRYNLLVELGVVIDIII